MHVTGLLAAALLQAAPVGWQYRAADGVEHFVGDAADVPPAYRASARPIDVSGVPLNRDAEKSLETSERREAERRETQGAATPVALRAAPWLPGAPPLLAAALLLAGAALLLHRLRRGRWSGSEGLWRAARLTSWLAGLGFALFAARVALPHLGRWRKRLAPFGLDALIAEEERNSDVMRLGIQKKERQSLGLDAPGNKAKPPPSPFWSGAPPPPGLLHQ